MVIVGSVIVATRLWSNHPGPSSMTGDSSLVVTVTRVLDGDTFDVIDDAGTVRVRILGIDAPEISHDRTPAECGGQAAATALTQLLLGVTVTLTTDPVSDTMDQYGRLLRYVTLDGVDVGAQMITSGMAEAWYPPSDAAPTRYRDYHAEQQTAQTARTGSWASCDHLGR
jgi:micrococcal nuclease